MAAVDAVVVTEVGPRDGLQNEDVVLPVPVRAELVGRLATTGVSRVEAVSFVHPRLVPAMAGAEDVLDGVDRRPGTTFGALVLNRRGLGRAVAAGVPWVNYAFGVTDGFTAHNQNTSVDEAVRAGHDIVRAARSSGLGVTVTLSTAFGCPFDGEVRPAQVLAVAERVLEVPPDEICVADTIGVGVPSQVRALATGLAALGATAAVHLHDTRGTGLANALAALDAGVRHLDASVGGTGGCPFAPGATGNIATEDLVYLLHGMGVRTGIDLDALLEVSAWLAGRLGRPLAAAVARAGVPEWFPRP